MVVEKGVVMPSFTKLERNDAHTVMRRVTYAFDMMLLAARGTLATLLAHWFRLPRAERVRG